MNPNQGMSVEQFGQVVKSKYPAYQSHSDAEVGQAVLSKYPQYNSYISGQSQQGSNPIGDAIGGVVKSATLPFRQAAQGLSDLGASGSYLVDKNILKDPNADQKFLDTKPASLLSDQENQQLTQETAQNAPLTAVKMAAGMGSYAVPFGKGASLLSKVLLPGAAAGGLQEFSNPDSSAGSVAAAAGTGAATAGLLHGAGKLVGPGLDYAGNQLRSSINHIRLPDDLYGSASEDFVNSTVNKHTTGSAGQKYAQIGPAAQKLYSDIIEPELKNNPQMVPLDGEDGVVSKIVQKMQVARPDLSNDLAKKAAKDTINNMYARATDSGQSIVPDKISTAELFKIKQNLNQTRIVDNFFNKGLPPTTPEDEAILAARNVLGGIVSENHPNVAQATKEYGALSDAAASLSKARDNTLSVPVLGKVPVLSGLSGAVGTAGDVLGKIAGGVGNLSQQAGSNPLFNNAVNQVGAHTPDALYNGLNGGNSSVENISNGNVNGAENNANNNEAEKQAIANGYGNNAKSNNIQSQSNQSSPIIAQASSKLPEISNNTNFQANHQTNLQQINDWYQRSMRIAAFSPQLKSAVDAQYQSKLQTLDQDQLTSAIGDVQKRIQSSPTGALSGGLVDWIRRKNDPNYAQVVNDLNFIDSISGKYGAPLKLSPTSDADQVLNELNSLMNILGSGPASSTSPLPAMGGVQ